MTFNNNKPLVTFTICAYNQEQFIREAVEGAFAQTYSPLEIILSDDCSQDRTFEIMREMAEAYRGPHQIVLNRNPVNYGLGKHVNRLAELTHGDYVVVAAGDDISCPERTEKICEIWSRFGQKPIVIQSDVFTIDEKGNLLEPVADNQVVCKFEITEKNPSLEDYIRILKPGMLGASMSYNPTIFRTFGSLPDGLIHEDNVIVLRALLMGFPLLFTSEPLVKRRIHGNNIFSSFHEVVATCELVKQQEMRTVRNAKNRVGMYEAFLVDLKHAEKCGLITVETREHLERECLRCHRLFSRQSEYADTALIGKLRIVAAARRDGADNEYLKWMLIRLLPSELFNAIKAIHKRPPVLAKKVLARRCNPATRQG